LRFSGTIAAIAASTAAHAAAGPAAGTDDDEARFRALYKTLVEIDTTRFKGDCTRAAEAMRTELLAAGYKPEEARIYAPAERPRDGALIAELRGRDPSLKPILLLAHIDVVEARAEDWAVTHSCSSNATVGSARAAPATTKRWARSLPTA
jgi:hypothetical protein